MTSTPALKEWAVICHALLGGEQIIDLRKGGLVEDGRHFGVNAPRAYLYPTAEHQRVELLKDAYRHWIDLAPNSVVGQDIVVYGWVDIVESHTITDPEILHELTSKVIWSDDYAASRLKWKSRDPLWVLILRAYRLAQPFTVAWNANYGGCTSWVELAELPDDPTTLAHEPALSDVAFAARAKSVRCALGLT